MERGERWRFRRGEAEIGAGCALGMLAGGRRAFGRDPDKFGPGTERNQARLGRQCEERLQQDPRHKKDRERRTQ